ncbi:hypothetical protein [Paracoccus albus]|uniref:hypothetical protein n=1 Tax=Paracoccus albus TaxID=3017784 RepID=UPI0022F023A9|nr:hypothetical protein [Paracoccus albus]WBU61196.1 hypothetical protein PAF20_04585 [Paracoccus albus]
MAKYFFAAFDCYCGSLGCIECRTRTQANVSAEFVKVFDPYAKPAFITVIPEDAQYTSDELADFDLNAFVLKHRRRIAACLPVDCIAAGCVDFSLNVFENGEGKWSVHLHLILSRMLTEKEKRVLKAKYPRDPENNVFVPVKQKAIQPGTLSDIVAPYVYKNFFTLRSIYIAIPKSGYRNSYRDSVDQPLSVPDAAVLNAALGRFQVMDPLILIGLKRARKAKDDDPASITLITACRGSA